MVGCIQTELRCNWTSFSFLFSKENVMSFSSKYWQKTKIAQFLKYWTIPTSVSAEQEKQFIASWRILVSGLFSYHSFLYTHTGKCLVVLSNFTKHHCVVYVRCTHVIYCTHTPVLQTLLHALSDKVKALQELSSCISFLSHSRSRV